MELSAIGYRVCSAGMTWNTQTMRGKVKNSVQRIIDYALNPCGWSRSAQLPYVAGCMLHCEGCYNVATRVI